MFENGAQSLIPIACAYLKVLNFLNQLSVIQSEIWNVGYELYSLVQKENLKVTKKVFIQQEKIEENTLNKRPFFITKKNNSKTTLLLIIFRKML